MTVKILQPCKAEVSHMWYCGDVCRCSHTEWETESLNVGEEYQVYESFSFEEAIKLDGLVFKRDYEITQYP